ncbi:GNAT family N-acetyltransferase [Pseudohoeflea suaedae]|uniref:L-ornithine N(alpha)-acyltransferase n=1 Tax=Pseudohoeflea suaedae TaxID=877384 RepID=A0A4R5PM95_9HYPH|nr:GNAT family N-acyltransferase [Pseudohoeflea suaedae]TDH38063.1 GNAT family N-acetyltransferase [Pseudohoeflea suaedae]
MSIAVNTILDTRSGTLPPFRGETRKLLARIGTLVARVAEGSREIEAAQALRYKVLVEAMGAELPDDAMRLKRDVNQIDAFCDHLLVLDSAIGGDIEQQIVGTCRLLTQDKAIRHGGFYWQSEYDVDALVARHPDKRFMELGRTCVLPDYRAERTNELLLQGSWAYALRHDVQAMFGCVSFPGHRPHAHALALSFLAGKSAAPENWSVEATEGRGVSMDMMPIEGIQPRAALSSMPSLIKNYLHLGAMTSTEAVVDPDFGTTDVLVILPVGQVSERYGNQYGAGAGNLSA